VDRLCKQLNNIPTPRSPLARRPTDWTFYSPNEMPPLSYVNDPSSSNKIGRGGVGGEVVSSQRGTSNDPYWKARVRHKQHRLLLLHHSSKCSHKVGKCKVTPLCVEMKNLVDHMTRCSDNECRVPHCSSSKSILIHYRKCQDRKCPVCARVRETLRKTQKGSRGLNPQGPHIDNQSLILRKDQEIASKNRIRSLQVQLRYVNIREKKVAESASSEVKEDLEDTKELTMQQTLATKILQGRIDELVEVARAAGANESVLLGIKNRSLASGR